MEEILVQDRILRPDLGRMGDREAGTIWPALPTVPSRAGRVESLEIHMIDVSPSNIALAD
jgi:hypothetical protein